MNVLLVGLGRWGEKHLRVLTQLGLTVWVADVSGGPYQFTATKPGATELGLEAAHRDLHITSAEFDAVARIDTPGEAAYYRNGGIMPYVLRSLLDS